MVCLSSPPCLPGMGPCSLAPLAPPVFTLLPPYTPIRDLGELWLSMVPAAPRGEAWWLLSLPRASSAPVHLVVAAEVSLSPPLIQVLSMSWHRGLSLGVLPPTMGSAWSMAHQCVRAQSGVSSPPRHPQGLGGSAFILQISLGPRKHDIN